jgi:hypothetical protein
MPAPPFSLRSCEYGLRDSFYGLEFTFADLLKGSPYVTKDPAAADYFYVPVLLYWGAEKDAGKITSELVKVGHAAPCQLCRCSCCCRRRLLAAARAVDGARAPGRAARGQGRLHQEAPRRAHMGAWRCWAEQPAAPWPRRPPRPPRQLLLLLSRARR